MGLLIRLGLLVRLALGVSDAFAVRPTLNVGLALRYGVRQFVLVVGASLLAVGCRADPTVEAVKHSVVYGDDDRTDVYVHARPELRQLATESIVALVAAGDVDATDPMNVELISESLEESFGLCSTERFLDQPTAANCSGTLIDDDLVLTAGHCVSASSCASTSFVFNYYYEGPDQLATIQLDRDVYDCAELVVWQDDGSDDYAIVRLARAVAAPHRPAPVWRGSGPLSVDDPLVVIGFGSGLPMKIDDGGEVLDPQAGSLRWFGANLDTFGGNSGSGVFNESLEVVGILVRGEPDYESNGDCDVVAVLPESPSGGEQEECSYVTRALDAACASGLTSRICGDGSGLCRPCVEDGECPDDFVCRAAPEPMGFQFCAPECGARCPEGTRCDNGSCLPDTVGRCVDGELFSSLCGRIIEPLQTCRPASVCLGEACVSATSGNHCGDAIAIDPVDQVLQGTHSGRTSNESEGSCVGRSAETVYRFALPHRYGFVAESSGFDTGLYLRSVCDDPATELACDDDGGSTRLGSRLELELDAGEYFLFMDGYQSSVGTYSLALEFTSRQSLDAGVSDSGPVDSGSVDSGPVDSGFDAGRVDAGFDAGPMDGGIDTGPADAGFDAGPADAGPVDAGLDAGVADAGVVDAGVVDAGVADAGVVDADVADANVLQDALPVRPDTESVDAGDEPDESRHAVWCGCRVPGARGDSDGTWLFGLVCLLGLRRRARARLRRSRGEGAGGVRGGEGRGGSLPA